MSDQRQDATVPEVVESRTVLKKYDAADGHDLENATPLEEVHIQDGEIVVHIVNEEVVYDKHAGVGEKPDFSGE